MEGTEKKYLKVGQKVMWRGSWGTEPAKLVKVTALERVKAGQKEGGKEVKKVTWDRLKDNGATVIASLDNGHWCYGHQLDEYVKPE